LILTLGCELATSKPDIWETLLTSLLLDLLAGQPVARPPIWLMRQAGRYLPEYRALRQRAGSFLEFCYTPALAVEATLQPLRRFKLDAAILFSDILVVPDALGCPVSFDDGPKLRPVRDAAAIEGLDPGRLDEHLSPVFETVRRLRAGLPDGVALIGFAGAPWTVAAYMVEGEGSREFLQARQLAKADPIAFSALIERIAEATTRYLLRQVEAGAQAIQLFDSWAGVLPAAEFERWCIRPVAQIVRRLKAAHPDLPVIGFPRGAGLRYRDYVEAVSVDAVSLDSTMPMAWARDQLGGVCLQGNLDPVALLVGGQTMLDEADAILDTMARRRLIFNLGHGVLPQTDPAAVAALVERVAGASAAK
jgi:uroporphyrinogen decarboxylase